MSRGSDRRGGRLMTFGGYHTLVVSTRGVRDGVLLRETFGRAVAPGAGPRRERR